MLNGTNRDTIMRLSKRTQELISRSLNAMGNSNPDLNYSYIIEDLYVDEAQTIHDFFVWLHKINRPYGPANAQLRWSEFMSGEKPLTEYISLLATYEYKTPFGSNPFTNKPQKSSFTVRLPGDSEIEVAAALSSQCSNEDLNLTLQIIDQNNNVVSVLDEKDVFKTIHENEKNEEFRKVLSEIRGF